jgi:hypothetical protein
MYGTAKSSGSISESSGAGSSDVSIGSSGNADSGSGPIDSGSGPIDSGSGPIDSGSGPIDSDPIDSGSGPIDSGPAPDPGYTFAFYEELDGSRVGPWYHGYFELVNTGNVDIIITGATYVDATGGGHMRHQMRFPYTLYAGFTDLVIIYAVHDDDIITLIDNYGINPSYPS